MKPDIFPRDSHEALDRAATSLNDGEVILVPTDTVYGLAVLPTHPNSVKHLFAIKSRPDSVNLPIMVAGAEQLSQLGARISDTARQLLASQYVPGALTLVFGLDPERTPEWLSSREEIAVRIPDDAFLLALLHRTGPFLATSANRHGHGTPSIVAEILDQLEFQPDLVIDGGQVDTVPSTLVNCNTEPAKIEREGVIPADEIRKILNDR